MANELIDKQITAKIEMLASDGTGLARVNGKAVFVAQAVPGETVLCRVTEDRRSWSRAQVTEIIEQSPARIEPRCEFYGACGGCNLQHLDYSSQLSEKTNILKDAMKRIGGCDFPEPQVFPSEPWAYRNRMRFHAASDSGGWGLKARKSGGVIPVTSCPVADPGIGNLLGEEERKKITPPPEKNSFTVYARGGRLLREGGRTRGKIAVLDREFTLDASLFFQSNGTMQEKLITDLLITVAGLSAENLPMADLYCGVGTFAAFLGKYFSRVDMVEENKASAALARENTADIPSACYAQSCDEWAKNNPGGKYAFIVADPPRTGLEPPVTRLLARNGPPILAYVSCNPATLARDAKILTEGHYRLTTLALYDFYPQTAHIESLAVFER